MMNVRELIEKLSQYNQEAKVDVVTNNMSHEFSLSYDGWDGCDKTNCEEVSFYVDATCESESVR
jgi:hypothetical protein